MPGAQDFCRRLREALAASKMTQRAFGDHIGRDESTVSKWLSGTTEPSMDDLARMPAILGRPVDWLLGLDTMTVRPVLDEDALPGPVVAQVQSATRRIEAELARIRRLAPEKKKR